MKPRRCAAVVAALLVLLPAGRAAAGDPRPPALAAGHSAHGEAFNEGPRQAAYLMGGTGKVHFPVTTRSAEAQKFFDQGVGQLHGFWYFEAERSFRQVAALDPGCAMAYWGMALANIHNPGRARGFIARAVKLKSKADPRERLWIDAYAAFFAEVKKGDPNADRQRRRQHVRNLENIIHEHPGDLEAKAFLCFHIWDNGGWGQPPSSAQALEALIQEVLAKEPMHPVHHYRIHLWDGEKPKIALTSAARCGQSAPAIAHMWHMPGHIYAKLHRYADAAWQQEASARVDHRHMMRDRVLPDQIFNYAHNNQWLVEDLEFVGRVHDAVDLAKNMIELPRHPRYNTLNVKDDGTPYPAHGSSAVGRSRLIETLTRYELWDDVIALADTVYLEPTGLFAEQVKRMRVLGLAHFGKGQAGQGRRQIRALEAMDRAVRAERFAAAEKAEARARAKNLPKDQVARAMADALLRFSDKVEALDAALAELRGLDRLARGDKAKARELFAKAKDIPKDRLARVWLQLGDSAKAVQLASEASAAGPNQVFALAGYVDVLNRCGKAAEAQKQFQELRRVAGAADLDLPVLKRLAPLAKALHLPADWRVKPAPPTDVGRRPDLKDLGPFRWEPTPAPGWTLADSRGKRVSLKDYRGKPVVLIFYLGSGCPHCIEQLNAFEPLAPKFEAAGIKLLAVSTEPVEGLKKTFEKSKLPAEFPLLADPGLKVFKAYRAYDDFEKVPLHGTFLIDGGGRVRWQDVSYEPFTDVKFLLAESQRLLSLPPPGPDAGAVKAARAGNARGGKS